MAVYVAQRHKKPWTAAEDAIVAESMREDTGRRGLAIRLGRSVKSLQQREKTLRANGTVTWDQEPLSIPAVVALLGRRGKGGSATRRNLYQWTATGALRATRSRGEWRVTEGNLWAFLHDDAHWSGWDPRRLTRPDWREHFARLRGLEDALSVPDVSAQYGMCTKTLYKAIAAGTLRAQRVGAGPNGVLVRRFDVERHDWTGYIIPRRRGLYYGRLMRPSRLRTMPRDAERQRWVSPGRVVA